MERMDVIKLVCEDTNQGVESYNLNQHIQKRLCLKSITEGPSEHPPEKL